MTLDPLQLEKLSSRHSCEQFDCGDFALNQFLHRYALQSRYSGGAQTYVALQNTSLVGYYSLAAGSVLAEDAVERIRKGMARHPIPVVVLARLAVSLTCQGKGIGKGLLKDALQRSVQVADIAGIRAVLVHAKHDKARTWYEQFGFEASKTFPNHLYLLMKDVRKSMREKHPS